MSSTRLEDGVIKVGNQIEEQNTISLQMNDTIEITNQSIKELRDAIKNSTKEVIQSNTLLSKAQNFNSWVIIILTALLVVVGFLQVFKN